jgi:hypothetical protein
MTTQAARDWKVSTSYRILMRIGWATIAVAVYFATAAAILDSVGVWWIVAGLAVGVMLLAAVLPEPVPQDYLNGAHTRVDTRRGVD